MDWKGVIIKESLKDVSVLDHVGIVESHKKELGISGWWTVLNVIVSPDKIGKVSELLMKGLRKGWYAHFRRNGRILIIFRGKKFNIKEGSKLSLERVRNWAFKTYNILPEVFSLDS